MASCYGPRPVRRVCFLLSHTPLFSGPLPDRGDGGGGMTLCKCHPATDKCGSKPALPISSWQLDLRLPAPRGVGGRSPPGGVRPHPTSQAPLEDYLHPYEEVIIPYGSCRPSKGCRTWSVVWQGNQSLSRPLVVSLGLQPNSLCS